jgi:periplasmic divalent cation tolerance protein
MTDALIVTTTFASEEDAVRVARALLDERLVACVTVLPGARSLYRWQGAIADEREVVVLMKTLAATWDALLARLLALHPYETPECVATRVEAGSPAYLAWLAAALQPERA